MNHSDNNLTESKRISRRNFLQSCTIGTLVLSSGPLTSCLASKNAVETHGGASPANKIIPLNQDWLFGGKFNPQSVDPKFDDSDYSKITLPHCVANLSWQDWKPEKWQDIWGYRKHFNLPKELKDMRVFLHFDGVMTKATVSVNKHTFPQHLGGYLPFKYEITELLKEKDNFLTVEVDSRWCNDVPPQGDPGGIKRLDYLEPGGIHRAVHLEVVPKIYTCDVFVKPKKVLGADRWIDVSCSIDAEIVPKKPIEILVEMKDGERIIASSKKKLQLIKTGQTEAQLKLSDLGEIKLWDINDPHLYDIVTTILVEGKPIHDYHTRTGLREARFGLDGFYLNGKRLQIFGLNRHEIYPYVGFAMPDRVMRRDAQILRHELNCNMVRCSHYPQTEAFLNACDELGLLVWEETPGWVWLGNDPWKEIVVQNVRDMIVRDRNHPSIIIWGTRVNESNNDKELYTRTKKLAKSLDDSRPTSGSMTSGSIKTWKTSWGEDVFAYDDYHADSDGSVGIREPVEGYPYFLAEAVGQFNYATGKSFNSFYRRLAEPGAQQLQAIRHAQAHNKAAANPRNCGVIAWCAFEYASLVNQYRAVKYPGVADVFRIPKLGASFYRSQCDPQLTPVIYPDFYWDFGPKSPKGPGKNAAVFSNCSRLELFIDGRHHATLRPDSANYSNLKYPPFFADLEIEDSQSHPELRIDGYLDEKLVVGRSFSSDTGKDLFMISSDDKELRGDGIDATRVYFQVTDKFGAPRPFAKGDVAFTITGPGVIIGDNPFNLEESGGSGAIWIKTITNGSGEIVLQAAHPQFGSRNLKINLYS